MTPNKHGGKPRKRDQVSGKLRQIVAELSDASLPPGKIKPKARLREDLGFDSVGVVDLMVEVEAHFGIYFDPLVHDLEEIFSTLGALEEFLEGHGAD